MNGQNRKNGGHSPSLELQKIDKSINTVSLRSTNYKQSGLQNIFLASPYHNKNKSQISPQKFIGIYAENRHFFHSNHFASLVPPVSAVPTFCSPANNPEELYSYIDKCFAF